MRLVSEWLPLDLYEVPSGTEVFDWQVPNEWNIRDAYIETMDGERIVDFRDHNLHVLNYSSPVDDVVTRAELEDHLHAIPEHPDWIPYRTSYYSENWGFCLTQRQRDGMTEPRYRVKIDSDLKPGNLTYGECYIPGRSEKEVLIYTHVCHPSLCNDNLAGIAVTTALGDQLRQRTNNRFSYRLVFGPGTIGSITWLSRNKANLGKIAHGLVLGLLGNDAPHTYKKSRSGSTEIDEIASYVLGRHSEENSILDFGPYGYDERQFNSPGINLPMGRLTRSVNSGYPQYHTSADDLSIVNESRLQESLDLVIEILETVEENRHYVNMSPYCEPQLGKRGLYHGTGGTQIADRESAMLWLLNQADGDNSLLDIAVRSGVDFASLTQVAAELLAADLLRDQSATD